MKGAVFISLNEMVVEEHGISVWLDIIDEAKVDGVYTGTKNYPDEELYSVISVICQKLGGEPSDIVRRFGEYLFQSLHKANPLFADSQPDFFRFIESIDGVIHVEVHKLDEHAQTPNISVDMINSNEAILSYESPRKLCYLAEGLLLGAAAYYGVAVDITQMQCMHNGADRCRLHLVQSPATKITA